MGFSFVGNWFWMGSLLCVIGLFLSSKSSILKMSVVKKKHKELWVFVL